MKRYQILLAVALFAVFWCVLDVLVIIAPRAATNQLQVAHDPLQGMIENPGWVAEQKANPTAIHTNLHWIPAATNSTPLDWKPEELHPTNAPPPAALTVDTNGYARLHDRIIGRVSGTNFLAVPDVHGLQNSFDEGFALGARYGALAGRRNPDVADAGALLSIARALMQAEQRIRAQQPPPPLPRP